MQNGYKQIIEEEITVMKQKQGIRILWEVTKIPITRASKEVIIEIRICMVKSVGRYVIKEQKLDKIC